MMVSQERTTNSWRSTQTSRLRVRRQRAEVLNAMSDTRKGTEANTSDAVTGAAGDADSSVTATKRRSPAAVIIAQLEGVDVTLVEAVLVSVRDAYREGDYEPLEAALIEQVTLLQAMGVKLLKLAGN